MSAWAASACEPSVQAEIESLPCDRSSCPERGSHIRRAKALLLVDHHNRIFAGDDLFGEDGGAQVGFHQLGQFIGGGG